MPGDIFEVAAPIGFSLWWWAVAVLCGLAGLGCLGVARWLWRRRPRQQPSHPDPTIDSLRREALTRINQAATASDPRAGARGILRATKEFIALASGTMVDYSSSTQLQRHAVRDPRLAPLHHLVSASENSRFSANGHLDLAELADDASKVVNKWR